MKIKNGISKESFETVSKYVGEEERERVEKKRCGIYTIIVLEKKMILIKMWKTLRYGILMIVEKKS